MAKSVKITPRELPILKSDLNLEAEVVERLSALQGQFNTQFKERIEESQKEALLLYTEKLKTLKQAKAEVITKYDAEIKKYNDLIKELKGTSKVPVRKTPTKETPAKKTK